MTSHIYLAAGMWNEVVAANEQATRIAADRAQKAGRTPPGCGHANMWLMYGYLQQGRRDAARSVLDGCRASATGANGLAVRAAGQDPLDPDNIPAGSYIQMWSRYLIDTGEWTGALAAEDLPLGDLAGPKMTRAFVRALAAAKRSDGEALKAALAGVKEARAALDAFLAARPAGRERYRDRAGVLEREVEALAVLAAGRTDEAIAALRKAAAAERAMAVEFGPPFVDKPADELLGEVLISLGRGKEAIDAYGMALERAPNRALSVAGLARAKSMR